MNTDFIERPLCYVAAAYQFPDPVANTAKAIKVADLIQETGEVTAYAPHMNLLWNFIAEHSPDYWYSYDLAFLARADCLFRIVGKSVGADAEVEFATRIGIPVFYEVEQLLEWARSHRRSAALSTKRREALRGVNSLAST